ncbi:MAG: SMP-30/gluconolactonase/LRE family protein [Lysobacterales bacterium]
MKAPVLAALILTALGSPAVAQEQVLTVAFNEGPAWGPDHALYVSDISGNRIIRLGPDGRASDFRRPSNYANGLVFDSQGRLYACEYGDPGNGVPARITRTDVKTGETVTLVDSIEGRPLRGPNDITTDKAGRLYFTDTRRANLLKPWAPASTPKQLPASIYRIELDGSLTRVVTEPELTDPNGLMLSPDDRLLYVVDIPDVIRVFKLDEQGRAGPGRVFHDFSPGRGGDGMAIDSQGNLYVAGGRNYGSTAEKNINRSGVYVFTPRGQLIRFIPVSEDLVSNVAFGGPSLGLLFVTAGKSVFRFDNDIPGLNR